jgi:hypothetical protein
MIKSHIKIIILTLALISSNLALSQDKEYFVNVGCDNNSKLDLLIKKGIMTKNLCLRSNKNTLELILQGQSYSLGQYFKNKELDQFYNSAKTGSLSCAKQKFNGEQSLIANEYFQIKEEESNYLDQIANGNFPRKEFENLRDFLHSYEMRIRDLKKISDSISLKNDSHSSAGENVSIKGFGYADGVKNNDNNYDSFIYNHLCNANKSSRLLELISHNIPDSSSDPFTYFNSALSQASSKQANASKVRNVYLAKMRADNLRDKVSDIIVGPKGLSTILPLPSDAEISETKGGLNPDFESSCKGYCQMRRGAKLEISIPGLKDQMTSINQKENEISAYYNNPYANDQLLMNKFAMRTLLRDFTEYLNDSSNEKNDQIKDAKNIEKQDLLQIFAKTKSKSTTTSGSNNFVVSRAKVICNTGSNAPKCGTKFEKEKALKEYFSKKYINLVKYGIVQTPMTAIYNTKAITRFRQFISERFPASNLGKLNISEDIFNITSKLNNITTGFNTAMYKANTKAGKKVFKEDVAKVQWNEKVKYKDIVNNPDYLNLFIWGNYKNEKLKDNFYDELTENIPYKLARTPLNFDKLKAAYEEITVHEMGARFLKRYSVGSENSLKITGMIFRHYENYKCTRQYLLKSPSSHKVCKYINEGLQKSHHTLDSLADFEYSTISGVLDLSAVVYFPIGARKDNSSFNDIFHYTLTHLGQEDSTIVKQASSRHKYYSSMERIANPYFYQAMEINKNFWDTSLPLPKSLTTYFLKEKFNLPDNFNVNIRNESAGINKNVNFASYFDELIDWTTLIIRNSIKSVSKNGTGVLIEPKKLAELNYNSETKSNLMSKAGEKNYPFIILENGLHQRIMRDVYSSAYITAHSQIIGNYIYEKYEKGAENTLDEYNNILQNINEKSHKSKIGHVEKARYSSFKKIIDDELQKHSISNVKTVPWPNDDKVKTVHFLGNNWRAITELMGLYLLKAQGLEKVTSVSAKEPSSFQNYDKIKPEFIERFTGETEEILNYLHRVNIKFLRAHIREFPTGGNFNVIAETHGSVGPKNSQMGAQVSTIYSFADYTGAYVDILKQLTEVSKRPSEANKVSEGNWRKWRNYKYMLKPVPKDLKYVYYRPTDISIGGDHGVHGFLHTACHTGVLFPDNFNGKPNTRFHYQSRYKTPRGKGYRDYPSSESYRYQYDDSYYIPQNENLTISPLTMIKIKNPTSYLVYGDKGCNNCNCLKDKSLTEDKLRKWLKEGIELQFTSEFEWQTDKKVGQFAQKKYKVVSSVSDNSSSIRSSFRRNFKTGGKQTAYINHPSENYCLFSPIVPQSHEVGSGDASAQDDNTNVTKELAVINSCPFVEALVGADGDPEIGIRELSGLPDVNLTEAQFNEIKTTCNSAIESFPMDIASCKNLPTEPAKKSVYDACSFMPQSIAKKFGTEINGRFVCYKDAEDSLIVEGQKQIPIKHNDQEVGTYNAYLCDAVTKVFSEDKSGKGSMIWTRKKIRESNKIKLSTP